MQVNIFYIQCQITIVLTNYLFYLESTEKPRTKVVTIVEPSKVKSPGDNETESEDRKNEIEKENEEERSENKKEDIQLDDIDIDVNETENVNNMTTLEIVTSKNDSDNAPAPLSDNENIEKNSTKYIVGETINFNVNSGSIAATQDNNSSLISSPSTQDSSL